MLDFPRPNARVLVVGTTPDYVDLLRREHPGECLFLTDSQLRLQAKEPHPDDREEVLYRSDRQRSAVESLAWHQAYYGVEVAGVACFDCESMSLASLLARRLGVPYPTSEAVACCRDKWQMKERWQAAGTPTSRFALVDRVQSTIEFLHHIGGPCVMKPLSGSGSELVFRVDNEADCRRSFEQIMAGVAVRRSAPLYRSCEAGQRSVLIEELVEGDEYSCDFLLDRGGVRVVRLARKHPRRRGPWGTIEAYELSPEVPDVCREPQLAPWLLRAASSLGIDRAICMADFIVRGNRPVFLEVTPRCGGDCLPSLLQKACGMDVLGLAIDFARDNVDGPMARVDRSIVGLRLFAERSGTLQSMDTTALLEDPRVVSVVATRRPGQPIELPPADYDSWILGHVVYRPEPGRHVAEQNDELTALLTTEIAER